MSTGALAAALAKVQAQLPDLERDRTVEVVQKSGGKYSYSYVTLANLSKHVLPLLAANGLAFACMPSATADGRLCVRYRLMHESGEALEGEFPISTDGGIQMIGGRITYARRYCLAALVGVAADEDDESRLHEGARGVAQRAAAPTRRQPADRPAQRTARRAEPPPLPSDGPQPYTPAQRARLMALFGEVGIDDRAERLDIVSRLIGRTITSANELTKEEAGRVLEKLEEASKAENKTLRLAELAPPADHPEA